MSADFAPHTHHGAPREMIPRFDEPNLYNIPPSLHPTYRPLPALARLGLALFAIWVGTVATYNKKLLGFALLWTAIQSETTVWKAVASILKATAVFLLANVILQDAFLPPSRITTQDLINNHFLPSSLSKYESVQLPDDRTIRVHFLQSDATPTEPSTFSSLHMNHGFGAFSSSWLPILPKLGQRLAARRITAHDAVGFGFTDRPQDGSYYSPKTSSQIGLALLNRCQNDNVLLMGHSMGSLATLEMAAALPDAVNATVILVAPALGLMSRPKKRSPKIPQPNSVVAFLQACLLDPPVRYALRRAVGMQNFWKRGLKPVWGDSSLLTDTDALRYTWQSIGKGWEQGLLRFSRAISRYSESGLVQRVTERPNTRLIIVRGTKDAVISKNVIDGAFGQFPHVKIVEMEGLGHNPFEEAPEDFCQIIEGLLGEDQ